MDFYLPIKHAFSVKPCSGIAIIFWSCGLLFFYLSVQGILNDRKIYISGDVFPSSFLRFATSDVDKEYIKRYNLMDGPAKVDELCTLGTLIVFISYTLIYNLILKRQESYSFSCRLHK